MRKIIKNKFFLVGATLTLLMVSVVLGLAAVRSVKATRAEIPDIRQQAIGNRDELQSEKTNNTIDEQIEQIGSLSFFKSLPQNKYRQLGPAKSYNVSELEINAGSATVIDVQSNILLYAKNIEEPMPIASITKLMTALVFLDNNPGWETIYTMKDYDRVEGGKIYVFLGEQLTVKDLFYLSLVGSDNTATLALVHSTGLSESEFVALMNKKAKDLGLINTSFNDIVGLSRYNVATAKEVAILAKIALSNSFIRKATLTKEYKFTTLNGKEKSIKTTDEFLNENGEEPASLNITEEIKIIGGKTGYTEAAGYCFVGWFVDDSLNEIITVVLGADSKLARFTETEKLAEWVYDNYDWQ